MKVSASAAAAIAGAVGLTAAQGVPAAGIPELDSSTRLLVVAPHPDDEALGAAGLIQRVRERGGAVRVVSLTSGDSFPEGVEVAEGVAHPRTTDYRGYGVLREHETRSAMQTLGVAPGAITFLGFPDELFLVGEPASLPECWCDGENVATQASPTKYRRQPPRP